MMLTDKNEEVEELCSIILKNLNERETDLDVAFATIGNLFASLCDQLNLDADQFLFLCKQIAGKHTWTSKEKKNEKTKPCIKAG